jgi:hypothetical protein
VAALDAEGATAEEVAVVDAGSLALTRAIPFWYVLPNATCCYSAPMDTSSTFVG